MKDLVLASALIVMATTASSAQSPCTPETVIINARIHTVDSALPAAEAIAVCGATIARVGTSADIRAMAGSRTRVIDAGGRLVVPGFNDAHVHLIAGANEIVGVDLRPAKDEQDFVRRLREYAAQRPKGEWIRGGYWDHEAWPSRALPTRELIDAATPDHPVFVQRLDGHMALANSLALKLAKVSANAKDPEGGAIVRTARGEPAGVFKDNAMELVSRAIPQDTLEQTITKARAALTYAASVGVTSIQDMTASPRELRAYQELHKRGELTARIYSIQNYDGAMQGGRGGDEWIHTGARKLFADGSMGSGTAAFFEPYADDPKTSGLLLQSPEVLQRMIFEADAAGFQPVVHAIGDRANAIVLDALAQLARERGARDRRPRIEHAQVVRSSDKVRFRAAGVIASIQPSHCIDDMRWAERRIGKERTPISYNFKSFLDAGARIAFGTDWYVEPLNPMLGLYAAVTRQFPDGTPEGGWFPDERITMAQAIEYYTLGSAFAEFEEQRKGSLTAGKLADLVVLSKDVFSVPPREILDTKPTLTMVGGRIVFEASATAAR
jgi:predicted amidohydrolase YtcJ